jgi:cell division protein FtsQ
VLPAVAVIAIVATVAWVLYGSRLLVVRSVQVVGSGRSVQVVGSGRSVSAAQVLAAARVQKGVPLIRVNTGAIARRVEQLRQVQYAQVSKDWPATVVIKVQPRIPVFAVRAPDGYALVDRFDVSVRDVQRRPSGLPLLTAGTGGAVPGSSAARAAAVVLAELPRRLIPEVRTVAAPNSSDVSVTLAGGVVIVWGDTGRASQKARELTVLMRSRARFYDVSGPGTAVTSG